jgi:tetratricopeptide (TPR) repeat protein
MMRRMSDPSPDGGGDGVEPSSELAELVAAAQRRSAVDDPQALAAWERLASSGHPLDGALTARIAQARALAGVGRDPAEDRAAFLAVAEQFRAVGDASAAVVNKARAALAAARAGDPGTARRELAAQLAEIRELHEAGRLEPSAAARVALAEVRRMLAGWTAAPGDRQDGAELGELVDLVDLYTAAQEVLVFTERHELTYLHAQARILIGRVALIADERDRARHELEAALAGLRAVAAPWAAAEPLGVLASMALEDGDPVRAELLAGQAQEAGRAVTGPAAAAHLAGVRAQAIWLQGGRAVEVIDPALTQARLLDPVAPVAAARARLLAALALHACGRPVEAVSLLERIVPVLPNVPDDDAIVARQVHARCLGLLGEPRPAARLLLDAAALAARRPDPGTEAALLQDAAEALDQAGVADRARDTYRRAAVLWRQLDQPVPYARAVRAIAWLDQELAGPDLPPDRAAGLAEVEQALAGLIAVADDRRRVEGDSGDELRQEITRTLRQRAVLIQRWVAAGDPPAGLAASGLANAEQAAASFARLGEPARAVELLLLAAWLEARALDRPEAARARLEAVLAECEARGASEEVGWCRSTLAELALPVD